MRTVRKKRAARRVIAAAAALSAVLPALLLSGCGQKAAEAGEVVETGRTGNIQIGEDVVLTIEASEYMTEVKPPDPMGYYDYYPETDGWRYLVLTGSAENTGETDFEPTDCYVEGYVDGEVREGKLLILAPPQTEFWDVLPAGGSAADWKFYLFTLVREEEEPEEISLFYNDDHSQAGEAEPWDHQIRVSL